MFDRRAICPKLGEFDQDFSKMSNSGAERGGRGGWGGQRIVQQQELYLAGGHEIVVGGLEAQLIVAAIFTKSRLRIRMYISAWGKQRE